MASDLASTPVSGLAVQAGDNPRLVADKLMSYLPPAQRDAADEPESGGARAAAAEAA